MFRKICIIRFLICFILCLSMQSGLSCYAVKDTAEVGLTEQKQAVLTAKINFDDVLKKAKEHSYDLKIADYKVLISKQEVRGARSEYFPKLNVGGGYEYTKNYRDLSDSTVMSIGDAFINPYTRFQSLLGVTVSYNLFDFGIRGGHLKIAKEDVKLKELETKEKFQEMSMTLLDSYAKVLVTTKQIEINKEILALEEQNLEMKERLYKAHDISRTELNDERVKVTVIKNRLADLSSIRQESLNWLSFYTGEEYDSDNLKVSDIKTRDFDVFAFQDYTKSVTWKIHEKNIKKKELELTVAKRNYMPKLNAYGRYYLYGSDYSNVGRSFGIQPSNFSVGASLNMPVFDGFKNSALVQKTALELKQLQVERDKAIAELATKLANMRSNLIYLDDQVKGNIEIMNELTDKETSMKKLASKRLVSPVEVNDAKIELLNQEIEYEKNNVTCNALTRGIQILTEEE